MASHRLFHLLFTLFTLFTLLTNSNYRTILHLYTSKKVVIAFANVA